MQPPTKAFLVIRLCIFAAIVLLLGGTVMIIPSSIQRGGSVLAASPATLVAIGLLKALRWGMFWFSTPAEQLVLKPERDGLVGIVRAGVSAWQSRPDPSSSIKKDDAS